MKFYLIIEGLNRDSRRTYRAKQIGCHTAGKVAPGVQDRLAAHLMGIGNIHLHPKWQALGAELS
jgi:hypothetical protein